MIPSERRELGSNPDGSGGPRPSECPTGSRRSRPILGTLIRRYREDAYYQQKELAARLNLWPASVSAWENGHKRPTEENVRRLCDVLGIPTEEMDEALGRCPCCGQLPQ